MTSVDSNSEICMDDIVLNSEFNFAEFYAEHFNTGKYIYSIKSSTWYYYNDLNILIESKTKYPIFLKVEICKNFDNYFRNSEEHSDNDKLLKMVGSSSFSESMMSFLRSYFSDDDVESKIDGNTNLLAFKNGYVYDISKHKYRKIRKKDFITKTMSIDYDEDIDNNKIEEINKIVYSLFEDETLTEYFIKTLALSLFTTKFEKLHILTGSGRNGKSLIMGFLSNILKDYATTAEADFLTSKMRNGISCTLINAKNTRMVLLSEPSNDTDQEMKLNNALIKSLTGNDNITARALYKNSETFKPTFNVFLLCNEIPTLEKVEFAMVERLNILKFKLSFVHEQFLNQNKNNRLIDVELKRRLDDDIELQQAFMHVLFEKAYDNIDKQFSIPKSVKDAKLEYLDETDTVKHFIENTLDITDNQKDRIKANDLYTTFKTMTKDKMGSREFFKSLERHGLEKLKSCGVMCYTCVKYKQTTAFNSDCDSD